MRRESRQDARGSIRSYSTRASTHTYSTRGSEHIQSRQDATRQHTQVPCRHATRLHTAPLLENTSMLYPCLGLRGVQELRQAELLPQVRRSSSRPELPENFFSYRHRINLTYHHRVLPHNKLSYRVATKVCERETESRYEAY